MVIQHNLHAMFTDRQLGIVDKNKSRTSERLSSGYRINRAADDAAGLAISEKMRYQIRGLNQGANNIKEGIGYCQTADGALNEIEDMIHRMNELAIKAANGTNAFSDRDAIDQEVQALKTEMERICETTKYNEEYIFRGKEDKSNVVEVYNLKYSGYPDDLYIYNESYDSVTGTAAYGGVAYRGKRYSWAGINSDMYDNATGMFRKGTYTLKADDGSNLTLVCEDGSKPPQVSRRFTASASEAGISVNGELIRWGDVKTASGVSLSSKDIRNEPYYFQYHGVVTSFTPEPGEDFYDVIIRMNGTLWESRYRVPTEEQALYADFGRNYVNFRDNEEVKKYLDGDTDFVSDDYDYIIRAGDGTNGTFDGIWLEQNGTEVAGSRKSWAEVGMADWGNGSRDIWTGIDYKFVYDADETTDADTDLSFKFQVINEISKDSAIDALDGVNLAEIRAIKLDNHAELEVAANQNVLGGKIIRDTIQLTLQEEYGLGRDYTKISDTFGKDGIKYDKDNKTFSIEYTNTVDSVTTKKDYANSQMQTDTLVNTIKKKMTQDMDAYLKVITARYLAGAAKPNDINLAALVGQGKITGGGGTTYPEDVVKFNPSDANLKSTLNMSGTTSYAGAKIDFSDLGTGYQLGDLIGMGFNSTCQTCNNHYSIQFTTSSIVNTTWSSATAADGNTYQYSYEKSGQNHTLYINLDTMMGKINNGTEFTNAVVDVISAAKYDFHFSQYATYSNNAELYVFDNRPQYAANNSSSATNASFSPFAYGFNTIAEFDIDLSDKDNLSEGVKIRYEYDYADLYDVSKLNIQYQNDPNGDYVLDAATNQYVKYDPSVHAGQDRYKISSVSLDTQGKDLDVFLEEYIRNTMFQEVAGATKMGIVSEYAKYGVGGVIKDNKAMVTEYDTPYQIKLSRKGPAAVNPGIRIQCSSNVPDYIYIPKMVLSLYGMSLIGVNVRTEEDALRAVTLAGRALNKVSSVRSEFGAYQNRLEHAYDNVRNTAENTTASESRIRDTDMAKEMVAFSISNILAQTGESMLAQANMSKQGILSLMQA